MREKFRVTRGAFNTVANRPGETKSRIVSKKVLSWTEAKALLAISSIGLPSNIHK
jgi:hypothetical protein